MSQNYLNETPRIVREANAAALHDIVCEWLSRRGIFRMRDRLEVLDDTRKRMVLMGKAIEERETCETQKKQ